MSYYDNGFESAQRSYENQEDPNGDVRELEAETLPDDDQPTEEELHLAEEAFRALGKVI